MLPGESSSRSHNNSEEGDAPGPSSQCSQCSGATETGASGGGGGPHGRTGMGALHRGRIRFAAQSGSDGVAASSPPSASDRSIGRRFSPRPPQTGQRSPSTGRQVIDPWASPPYPRAAGRPAAATPPPALQLEGPSGQYKRAAAPKEVQCTQERWRVLAGALAQAHRYVEREIEREAERDVVGGATVRDLLSSWVADNGLPAGSLAAG